MAKNPIDEIKKDAEALYLLKETIKSKKEAHKTEIDALEIERDACEALIMAAMKKVGIASLKVENGDTVAVASRTGVEITSPAYALKWATENKAVTIDKRLVGQLLKDMKEMPAGFELVNREYISVRKPKGSKEE